MSPKPPRADISLVSSLPQSKSHQPRRKEPVEPELTVALIRAAWLRNARRECLEERGALGGVLPIG